MRTLTLALTLNPRGVAIPVVTDWTSGTKGAAPRTASLMLRFVPALKFSPARLGCSSGKLPGVTVESMNSMSNLFGWLASHRYIVCDDSG